MRRSSPDPVMLSEDERATLQRWARRPSSAQALALRCRIVLACADGGHNNEVAERVGVNRLTVGRWRARFLADQLDGLHDEPRPGAPRQISDDDVERVVVKTLEETARCHPLVDQIDGHRVRHVPIGGQSDLASVSASSLTLSKISSSLLTRCLIEKVRDIVGLYLNPPDAAMVFYVDDKSQIQALDRASPVLPLVPGTPQRRTHDYVRHGTTNLYAALDVSSGKVITTLTDRHRADEFQRFLNLINRQVPDDLDAHVIADNFSTHKPQPSDGG